MTHQDGMAYVLRECREFLGTSGTTMPQYSGHVAYLCSLIGQALAGPPPAPDMSVEAMLRTAPAEGR